MLRQWARLPVMCLIAGLVLSACGLQTPLPDTARVAPGSFGSNGDDDIAAVNLASWAFSSSSNTRNRPIEAARAVAAVDYLGGALTSSGRWITLSPLVQDQMLQARKQVRAATGIAPDAPSQVVVSSLVAYAGALQQGSGQAQAAQYLTNPVFTLGPQMTEARLDNLPFLPETNVATQRARVAVGNGAGVPDSFGR